MFLSSLTVKPVVITAAILLTLALIAVGTTRWQLSREKAARAVAEKRLSDYQAAASAVIAERLRAQLAADARNKKIAEELRSKHANDLQDIQRRYADALDRLRDDLAAARERAGVPAPAPTPGGVDEGDSYSRLLAALARCEEGLRQLSALQRWIRETR